MYLDEFKQYDYGLIENMQLYGQPTPPFYPLDQISAPVVTFCSKNDHMSSEFVSISFENNIFI